ncbi:sensor histidine kinase [Streptomyces hygroscopicus]|uniref:sensor histidine kinase n=1 Tax=Streptomyces hygroscopicus TaxID=1912 RepID=UPI00099EBA68|nr:HAMP domain-containing sensor histidine kinase [Streptomyces hygroscopicus]GLV74477.1 two-component sensor histidine kinase [Streptomyces hygroscopicus subsp. hygroscopicus]
MRRDVPLRRSLLLRLLAVSVLVSVCSVAATAWLAVRTTAVAIREERGQALADDTRIYDRLLGYAARHPRWDGVGPTVRALARETGHRIVITGDGRRIADSEPAPDLPYRPPAKATAVIDPLAVSPDLLPDSASDRIDPRAVGPFRLSEDERTRLRGAARRQAECLRTVLGQEMTVVEAPSGRPRVESGASRVPESPLCASTTLDSRTPTEARALSALTVLVNTCLSRRHAAAVKLTLDDHGTPRIEPLPAPRSQPLPAPPSGSPQEPPSGPRDGGSADGPLVASCLASGRAQQLGPYVAPTAALYVTSPSRSATTFFDLSAGNRARIAGGAVLVLLVTVTATTLAGLRLVRPLRALTEAARRMAEGEPGARVAVTGNDELGRLTSAFNAMSRRRDQLEAVRKDMVSDVAHELRTPLSNIRGWLEGAQDGVVPQGDLLVSSLLEEALHLQHLIDDLRDLSAADAGELRLNLVEVDIADLLAHTATAHHAAAENAGVTLRAETPGDRVAVEADQVRLYQAVGNLVANALRHTPSGGAVSLRAHRAGDEVLIEVADTGSGIAAEDLPHVFDRFWRADKSRSRRTGGSGLGLSIVRKLVQAHGGTVSASSTLGEGSVFTIRLPRAPLPPAADGTGGRVTDRPAAR